MGEPAAPAGPEAGGAPAKRLITVRRAANAFAALLMACGALVLLLPYQTTVDLDVGGTTIFQSSGSIEGRCEAPLLDAFRGESDAWLNYAPDTGTTVSHQQSLTGVWCSPQSLERAAAGAALVVTGMSILLVVSYVRHRRIRRAAREAATEHDRAGDAPPPAVPGAADPEPGRVPGGEPEPEAGR